MFTNEEITGTVLLKISGNPGSVVARPKTKISGRGGGSFLIAVHGGSPNFYWNSPKYISPSIKDCERKMRRSPTSAALLGLMNRNVKLEQNF